MDDWIIVEEFVAHLRNHGHPALRIDSRPDVTNRRSRDIDAIAGDFAIEHTSIDSLSDQRRHAARFRRFVHGVTSELRKPPSFCIRLSIAHDAITVGNRS